jgi:hypothetical protein
MFNLKQRFGRDESEENDEIEKAAKLYLRGFEARGMPVEEDGSKGEHVELLTEKDALPKNNESLENITKKVLMEDNGHEKTKKPKINEPRIIEPHCEELVEDDLGQLIAHANAFLQLSS